MATPFVNCFVFPSPRTLYEQSSIPVLTKKTSIHFRLISSTHRLVDPESWSRSHKPHLPRRNPCFLYLWPASHSTFLVLCNRFAKMTDLHSLSGQEQPHNFRLPAADPRQYNNVGYTVTTHISPPKNIISSSLKPSPMSHLWSPPYFGSFIGPGYGPSFGPGLAGNHPGAGQGLPPGPAAGEKFPIPRLTEGTPGAIIAGDPARPQRRHVSRACEFCRQRKTKCSGEPSGCINCQEGGIICCYTDSKKEKSKR